MSDLVCPECGESQFRQTRYAVICATVAVDSRAGEYDVSEEVMDGGDRDEPLRCECGAEYHDLDELVTEDAYAENAGTSP